MEKKKNKKLEEYYVPWMGENGLQYFLVIKFTNDAEKKDEIIPCY